MKQDGARRNQSETPPKLTAYFKKTLDEQGLEAQDVGGLIRPVTVEEMQARGFPTPPGVEGGLAFYYKAPDAPLGDPPRDDEIQRIRLLWPEPKGFAAHAEKDERQRYVARRGSVPAVYFPRIAGMSATPAEILAKPDMRRLITEGEKKCATLLKLGVVERRYFPIGISGVDSWRSRKGRLDLLPDLEAPEGSVVDVLFDSDGYSNPNVARAMTQLALEMLKRKVVARCAFVPPGQGGERRGVDDWLLSLPARERLDTLVKLLDEAVLPDQVQKILDLNDEVCYARSIGAFFNLRDRSAHDLKWLNLTFKPRKVRVVTHSQKLGPTEDLEPLVPRWLESPARNEVERSELRSGDERPLITERVIDPKSGDMRERRILNTWPGYAVFPAQGSVAPLYDILDAWFRSRDNPQCVWLLDWLSYPVQHRNAKLRTAVFLSAPKHYFKSEFTELLLGTFGDSACAPSVKDVFGDENHFLRYATLAIIDEAPPVDGKREVVDQLKAMIANKTCTIRQKYITAEMNAPNRTQFLFCANRLDAFALHDEALQSRIFMPDLLKPPLKSKGDAFERWAATNEGRAAFLHLLKTRPISASFEERSEAPRTAALERAVEATSSPAETFFDALMSEPDSVLRRRVTVGLKKEEFALERDLWRVEEISELFNHLYPDPNESKRMTGHWVTQKIAGRVARYEKKIAFKDGSDGRLYFLRNASKYRNKTTDELRKAYEKQCERDGATIAAAVQRGKAEANAEAAQAALEAAKVATQEESNDARRAAKLDGSKQRSR